MNAKQTQNGTRNRRRTWKWFLFFLITLHFTLYTLHCLHAVEDFIVDDFAEVRTVNSVGGNTGTWNVNPADKTQFCNAIFNLKNRRGDTGYCLRIDYDIESAHTYIKDTGHSADAIAGKRDIPFTAFNGYYTQLKGANLTNYKYLIFYVKGDTEKGFTRRFKIEIKDEKNCSGYIVEWLTDSWQRMAIPLSIFREITDWRNIREIGIVFDPNVTKKVGTIYIDDINFSVTKEERRGEQVEIVETVKPVLIDGALEEWAKAEQIKIIPEKHLEAGEISDKNDLSAYVWFMWDKEYLYFAARVTDNQIICRKKGADIWREDCIELFVDSKCDGLVWGDKKDFQIGFSPGESGSEPQSWAWFQKSDTAGVIKKSSQTEKQGYVIEAAIKWSFLDVHPKKGTVIDISPAIHDFDKDATPDGKLNWSYNTKDNKTVLGEMVLK